MCDTRLAAREGEWSAERSDDQCGYPFATLGVIFAERLYLFGVIRGPLDEPDGLFCKLLCVFLARSRNCLER
jgi:hypothetical protein